MDTHETPCTPGTPEPNGTADVPKDFLNHILDSVNDYILIVDRKLHVILANGAIETFYALSTGTYGRLQGYSLKEVNLSGQKKMLEAIISVFKTGEAAGFKQTWDIANRPNHLDGIIRPYYVDSEILYVIVVIRNITSEENGKRLIAGRSRRMEEQISRRTSQLRKLNMSLAVFKTLSDQARFGNVILDSKRTIVYANEYAARVHGRPIKELIGEDVMILHSPGEAGKLDSFLKEVGERGSAPTREFEHRYRGDIAFPMLCSAVAVKDTYGKARFLGMAFQDLSAQREMREVLERAKAAAEDTARSKSAFLANISHEIRTPLNAIIGFSELLHETELEGTQQDYAKKILTSGKTLLALINDVLDFSKIEAGKMDFDNRPFYLQASMEEVAAIFRLRSQKKGVELIYEVAEEVPDSVVLDEMRLKQVVMNLLSNALKFTSRGSITLELGFQAMDSDEGILNIKVADTGMGIDPEHQERIFQAFEQTGDLDSRAIGGTGLGLSIVTRIVRLFGGTIELESMPGKGSTFSITIPGVRYGLIVQDSPDSDTKGKYTFKGQTLLVVDDDDFNRSLIAGFFENCGLTVLEAPGGIEALDIVKNEAVDIVLMDIAMDGMNGVEALEKIRADPHTSDLPVLAFSASVMGEEALPMGEGGFDEFLSKPVTRSVAEEAVGRYLDHEILSGSGILAALEEDDSIVLNTSDVQDLLGNQDILDVWRKAYPKGSNKDIEIFADLLCNVETTPEGMKILEFADTLKRASASFDIVKIRDLMKQFAAVFQEDEYGSTENIDS